MGNPTAVEEEAAEKTGRRHPISSCRILPAAVGLSRWLQLDRPHRAGLGSLCRSPMNSSLGSVAER